MAAKLLNIIRGSSSSQHFMEDLEPVTCPICLEIYEKALTVSCGHSFCGKCLDNFNIPEPICPLCRRTFDPSKTVKSMEINKLVNSNKGACHSCSQKMSLSKLRAHFTSCRQVQEQVKSLKVPVGDIKEESSSNRHTFRCPYCGLLNLDTRRLIQHVNENHQNSTAKVTCPICVSMPWGDPNQVSSNFIGHLNHRHQFEYDTFVDYEIDDGVALQQALKASMEEEANDK